MRLIQRLKHGHRKYYVIKCKAKSKLETGKINMPVCAGVFWFKDLKADIEVSLQTSQIFNDWIKLSKRNRKLSQEHKPYNDNNMSLYNNMSLFGCSLLKKIKKTSYKL